MGKRFVFIEEVQDILLKGETEMVLPVGTMFSPAANDLIRENGIRVLFAGVLDLNERKGDKLVRTKNEIVAQDSVKGAVLFAVASAGKSVTGTVGNIAARSPYFLLFNGQGELVEVLDNPYRNTSAGAGPLVAELVASRSVKTLVAGNFGVNITDSLEKKGVNALVFSGTVAEAVKLI